MKRENKTASNDDNLYLPTLTELLLLGPECAGQENVHTPPTEGIGIP